MFSKEADDINEHGRARVCAVCIAKAIMCSTSKMGETVDILDK